MIYIISDSLSMPRPAIKGDGQIKYEYTYPKLLGSHLTRQGFEPEILNNHQRGRLMSDLPTLVKNCALHFEPDYLIVQLGIVDCAPRVLRQWQTCLVNSCLPKIGQRIFYRLIKFFRKYLLKYTFPKVFTSVSRYRESIREVSKISHDLGIKVIWVSIAPPSKSYIKKSPSIFDNIQKYNQECKNIVTELNQIFIDLDDAMESPDSFLLSDGHHLNIAGNKILADLLAEKFLDLKNEKS